MELIELIIVLEHVFISFIGTIGNALVIIVYLYKLNDKETSTFFILHLAYVDFICCILLVPLNCYFELNHDNIPYDFICKFHTFLNVLNITYSCLLMTLVAFERYFSIIWPFSRLLPKKRAKLIMFILFALCLLIALLSSVSFGIDHLIVIHSSNSSSILILQNITTIDGIIKDKFDMFHINDTNIQNNIHRTNACHPNNLIISHDLFEYIRLVQNCLFIVCFIIIFILYAAIFISVAKRRKLKKERESYYLKIMQRSRLTQLNSFANNSTPAKLQQQQQQSDLEFPDENIDMIYIDEDDEQEKLQNTNSINKNNNLSPIVTPENKRSSNFLKPIGSNKNLTRTNSEQSNVTYTDRDLSKEYPNLKTNLLLENIKTAFMLFVVTLTFAILFTPALLISFNILTYNPIYWNLYFLNNSFNPIIYSFLNKNFRKSLKYLIK
jgi:hypothetical protein